MNVITLLILKTIILIDCEVTKNNIHILVIIIKVSKWQRIFTASFQKV